MTTEDNRRFRCPLCNRDFLSAWVRPPLVCPWRCGEVPVRDDARPVSESPWTATANRVLERRRFRVADCNGDVLLATRRFQFDDPIRVDWVFVRDDGWALGSPTNNVRAAFAAWANHWVALIDAQGEPWRIAAIAPQGNDQPRSRLTWEQVLRAVST